MQSHKLTVFAAAMLAASPVLANDYEPAMRAFVTDHVMAWIGSDVLVGEVRAQNEAHGGLSQDQIDEMDLAWRAEVGGSDTPLITRVLSNPASAFLTDQVEASGGVISEVFVTDNHGLNVASSGVTSDYWQGDEAKFTEVYGHGPEAMHFGEVEFDESAQAYVGQVSLPVLDPASGEVIGVVTLGLDAEAL